MAKRKLFASNKFPGVMLDEKEPPNVTEAWIAKHTIKVEDLRESNVQETDIQDVTPPAKAKASKVHEFESDEAWREHLIGLYMEMGLNRETALLAAIKEMCILEARKRKDQEFTLGEPTPIDNRDYADGKAFADLCKK